MLTPKYPNRILFVVFFYWMLLCPIDVFTQEESGPEDTLSQQQFIVGCATYRQSIIHDFEQVLPEIVKLSNGLAQAQEIIGDSYMLKFKQTR